MARGAGLLWLVYEIVSGIEESKQFPRRRSCFDHVVVAIARSDERSRKCRLLVVGKTTRDASFSLFADDTHRHNNMTRIIHTHMVTSYLAACWIRMALLIPCVCCPCSIDRP